MARITPIPEEQILSWRERLRAAEELIEDRHLPVWRKVLQDYSGELYEDDDLPGLTLDSFERVNYLLATSNAILPTIIGQSPSIRVRPRRPQDADSAKTAQYALNWCWHTIKALGKLVLTHREATGQLTTTTLGQTSPPLSLSKRWTSMSEC